jgi:hypothetical protein
MKKIILIHNPNLLLGLNIWCNTRRKIRLKNLLFENFNCLIVRDFWMVKIWPYFHKFMWVGIFVFFFSIFLSQKHMFLKVLHGSLFIWTLWVFIYGSHMDEHGPNVGWKVFSKFPCVRCPMDINKGRIPHYFWFIQHQF